MPNWTITGLPIKHVGLEIVDLTLTAHGNWNILYVVTGHLVADLRGCDKFHSGDHTPLLNDGRAAIRRRKVQEAEESLSAAMGGLSLMEGLRLHRRQKIGAWLSVEPYMVNGMELGPQECRDSIFLRYGIETPDLSHNCYVLGVGFTILYDLYCKKGGYIKSSHNKLRDGVTNLASNALMPTHVRDGPLINPCCAVRIRKVMQAKSNPPNKPPGTAIDLDHKGNLLIRYLWARGTDFILYMQVVNMNAVLYIQNTLKKILAMAEMKKKCKYINYCLQQRRHCLPFVVSIDGLLVTQAEATLKHLASRLVTNWWQPYSWTCGYVRSRFAITIVRFTHSCIRGS